MTNFKPPKAYLLYLLQMFCKASCTTVTFPGLQGSNMITSALSTNWPVSTESPKNHSGLLNQKKLEAIGSKLSSKHLLCVITSYPSLMCEKTTLPPFIHPRYPHKEQECNCPSDKAPPEVLECLAICTSLVHMYQSRTSANIAYIWKTIAAGQERLYSEYTGYDKWKLLSALQAVTIYLVIQMREEKHDNDACGHHGRKLSESVCRKWLLLYEQTQWKFPRLGRIGFCWKLQTNNDSFFLSRKSFQISILTRHHQQLALVWIAYLSNAARGYGKQRREHPGKLYINSILQTAKGVHH
jgi:hypothetical protein